MIIARVGRVSHSHEPEERSEIGRKLAIVAGLGEIGIGGPGPSEIERFIVRTAKAHVTIRSNNYYNEDDKTIIGRKLAMVAGIL